MKASLESKAFKVCIVIRKNKHFKASDITSFCENYLERYAWIKHEGDISPQTKEVEGVHYHVVGKLKERTRLGTLLNRLCKHLNIEPFGVEIDSCDVLEAMYQYLIHKNDKDKTQHDIKEIVSNIPADELQTIMECDNQGGLSVDRLWGIVEDNMRYDKHKRKIVINRRAIAKAIGLGRLNNNRIAIDWAILDTTEAIEDKLDKGIVS